MKPRRIWAWAAALAAALGGCVTEGGGRGGEGPTPAPRGEAPDRLSLAVPNFTDTDGNRYRDSTEARVFLFHDPLRYPMPIVSEGRFVFRLSMPGGRPIAQWSFDESSARASVREWGPGPGYAFLLDLRGVGEEVREDPEAELACEFIPASGVPVRSLNLVGVQVGPVRPAAR